jgi:hypothetical protein
MASGLSLGISATFVLSIWLAIWLPFHSLENLYWMKLSYATVISALWEAKQLAIGPHLLIALIALLTFGVLWPTTRMLTLAFLVAFGIFLFLPVFTSPHFTQTANNLWKILASRDACHHSAHRASRQNVAIRWY